MTIAVGSLAQLAIIAEATWGTTPTTPVGAILPMSPGADLSATRDFGSSKALRSDRMVGGVTGGVTVPTLSFEAPLAYSHYDSLLESALGGAWTANVLKVGTTRKSFTAQIAHSDVSVFDKAVGLVVDKMSISAKAGEAADAITVKFDCIGKTFSTAGTTCWTSTTAPASNPEYTAFTGAITEGGSAIASVTSLDLNIDNGLSQAKALFDSDLYDLGMGTCKVTGTLTAWFESATLRDKYLNDTASSLAFTVGVTSKTYAFSLGNVRYTSAKKAVGSDGFLALEMAFEALVHADTSLKITRTA